VSTADGVACDVEVVPVAAAGNAVGCRGRWQVVCVVFVADGRVVARLQTVSGRAYAVTD